MEITEAMSTMQENFVQIGSCLREFSEGEAAERVSYNSSELTNNFMSMCNSIIEIRQEITVTKDDIEREDL